LTEFGEDAVIRRQLPEQARRDLRVWAAAIGDTVKGLPIPHRPTCPSLHATVFVSDAAGAQFSRQGDRFIPYCTDEFRGAASLGCTPDNNIWFCARVIWPKKFLLHARDSRDHAYGCKSSTLEAVGIILPFLCCPTFLAGKEVILLTDNESIIFGWDSRRVKNDISASILIRSLHLMACFLGSTVSVRHLPRMSTPTAELADQLSRSSTTGPTQLAAISHAYSPPIPRVLTDWLHHPEEDWDLPYRMLKYVKSVCNT
jgi:hypothetical protein